jgi:chemotaxis response regulator CheB
LEGLRLLNKKILIAIIVIIAVSIAGTVALNVFLANNPPQFRGTLVFQADMAGVSVSARDYLKALGFPSG